MAPVSSATEAGVLIAVMASAIVNASVRVFDRTCAAHFVESYDQMNEISLMRVASQQSLTYSNYPSAS